MNEIPRQTDWLMVFVIAMITAISITTREDCSTSSRGRCSEHRAGTDHRHPGRSRGVPDHDIAMRPMTNRLPVGDGSRGGHWHDPAFRSAYFRAWRKAHPDYYVQDLNRRRLAHAFARLARVISGGDYSRP